MGRIIFNNPFMLGFEYMEETIDKMSKVSNSYPPYNIEQRNEDTLVIKLAVAGFLEEELSVVQDNNQLIISSCKKEDEVEDSIIYIHKGISFRRFERVFVLAEGLEPCRSYLENGILVVELKKIKQEKNLKVINIEKQISSTGDV